MAKRKTPIERERRFLTKEDLLGSNLKEQEVYIESLDAWLWIREMSAGQVQNDARKIIKNNGDVDFGKAAQVRVESSLRQVIDGPGGNRMFNEADIKDLMNKSGAFVTEIVDAVRVLSGQKKKDDGESLAAWMRKNYPQILAEYNEESPLDEYEENFT